MMREVNDVYANYSSIDPGPCGSAQGFCLVVERVQINLSQIRYGKIPYIEEQGSSDAKLSKFHGDRVTLIWLRFISKTGKCLPYHEGKHGCRVRVSSLSKQWQSQLELRSSLCDCHLRCRISPLRYRLFFSLKVLNTLST
jgi:hypothetical protein